MAKNSTFDTMHPLIEQRVHFCFVGKQSFLSDNWRGENFFFRRLFRMSNLVKLIP
jgi:hypothetical protein